ncbi:MAG: hypothetical protein IKL10_05610 [Clostridia bacterium]|nr:hypothetical protein [Clostridia bacterium]
MKVLKIILLISAGLTVALRLFTYENTGFVGEETARLLNIISIVSAGICLLSALIWVLILKKEEKSKKKNGEEDS